MRFNKTDLYVFTSRVIDFALVPVLAGMVYLDARDLFGFVQAVVLVVLFVAVAALLTWRRHRTEPMRHRAEPVRLWRELRTMCRQYEDDTVLIVGEPDDVAVHFQTIRNDTYGFIRTQPTDVTLPQIDEPGYISSEVLVLGWRRRVMRFPTGGIPEETNRKGELRYYIPPEAPVTRQERKKQASLLVRTKVADTTIDEVRELVDQLRRARPVDPD